MRVCRRIVPLFIGLVLLTWWVTIFQFVDIFEVETLDIANNFTTHQESKETQTQTKPTFVLHVGPPKTATTTIQCGLIALSAGLAEFDSYYYLGTNCPPGSNRTLPNNELPIRGHHLMLGLIAAEPNAAYQQLLSRMQYHHSKGNNIILSIESMSNHLKDQPSTWKLFLELFEGWHVQVVVAYRYYFDWIKSLYFQLHLGNKFVKYWPPEEGIPTPLFRDYLKFQLEAWETGNTTNNKHSYGEHMSLYAKEYFSRHFDDVVVFDFHQEGQLMTNFVCQMLPGATHTCQRLSDPDIHTNLLTPQRESQSFDAGHIAFAAYDRGLLRKGITRKRAIKLIEARLQHQPLPEASRTCLPPELEAKLLKASLWFDHQIATKRRDQVLEAAYEKAIQSHKYCEVNASYVLEMEEWNRFLRHLTPT